MHQLPSLPGLGWSVGMVALALAAWLILSWRWPLWLVFGFLWTAMSVHARLSDRLSPELSGKDFQVTGWVDGFPRLATGQKSFSLRVDRESRSGGVPRRLRLTWYDPPAGLVAGSAWELRVRLKVPRGLSNPGGFDYERWLFQQGYGATGYVRGGHPDPRASEGLARRWLAVRAGVAERINDAARGDDARVLLTALAIGERFGFKDRHWTGLRRTGTSHLVAISGLHVGLVAGFAFFSTRRLWLRLPGAMASYDLEAAAVASFGCAALYAAAAGFTVPTQRALIMLGVALAAVVARRSVSMTVGLAAALLFVLVWDPLAALSSSFWLSFIAVALLWQLGQARTLAHVAGWSIWARCRQLARVQWGISLGLVPVVVLFFGELSLISPLVNFVVIPLFSFLLVPLTLLAAMTAYVEVLGARLIACVGVLMQWTWWVLEEVASASWVAISLWEGPAWALLLAFGGVAAALCAQALPARYLAWIALIPLLVVTPARPPPGALEATVLDVGHGLAVLMRTHSHTLLYDTGPRYPSGFDAGREIVLPAMRAERWKGLDALMVSHADGDHFGGAGAVMAVYPDAKIYAGPDVDVPRATPCQAGQRWTWDGVVFNVLHPPGAFSRRGNDSSCVLRVSTGAGTLLVTGDIELAGELSLLRRVSDVRADVVVVPHHGSATSSTASFVAALNAHYALVSAGHANRWGFPRPDVEARWEGAGTQVLTTGDVGAITVVLQPSRGVAVTTRRSIRRRYWHAETQGVPGESGDGTL